MKQYKVILRREGDKDYETTLWLDYEPDYLFHDDGVYQLRHIHAETTLTYEYEGNALSINH